ncbi:MAG: chemotaxis protein CheW [Chromatiales bacterium]|nr:chemotaxis protein CheW [Chromatiales bacterium]
MTTNVAQTDLILFAVGPVHCAADSGPVDAVLAAGRLSHLPGERDSAGVLRHGGRLVTVVDLRQRFGLEPATGAGQRILVVETPAGPVGYRVDRVDNVVSRSDGRFGPTPRYVPRQVFPGTFTREGRIHLYADLARLRELPAAGWLQAAGLLPASTTAPNEPRPVATSPGPDAAPGTPPGAERPAPAGSDHGPTLSSPAGRGQTPTPAPVQPATTVQTPAPPAAPRPPVQQDADATPRKPGLPKAPAAATRAGPPSRQEAVRPPPAPATGTARGCTTDRSVAGARAGEVSHRSPVGDSPRSMATDPPAGMAMPASDGGAWGGLLLVAGLCLLLGLGAWLLLGGGEGRAPASATAEPSPSPPAPAMAPEVAPADSPPPVPAPVATVTVEPGPASEPLPPAGEAQPGALPTLQREGRRVTLILDEVPSGSSAVPPGDVGPESSTVLAQDTQVDAGAFLPERETAERAAGPTAPDGEDPASQATPEAPIDGEAVAAGGEMTAEEAPRLHQGRVIRREILHVVRRGDTLWAIAARYLDDPYRYPELARLSDIRNPDLIYPGDEVRILILGAATGE